VATGGPWTLLAVFLRPTPFILLLVARVGVKFYFIIRSLVFSIHARSSFLLSIALLSLSHLFSRSLSLPSLLVIRSGSTCEGGDGGEEDQLLRPSRHGCDAPVGCPLA